MTFVEGDSLVRVRKLVNQEQINQYALVSGDHNPIHLDSKFAVSSTFGRIVAHGMLVLAFVSEMLSQTFGTYWVEAGYLKIRFKAPVYPGDNLETYGSVTRIVAESGIRKVRCSIGCRKTDGSDVIVGEAVVSVDDN